MSVRTIEKTVDVAAPPERVWDVLLDDVTYRQWTEAFMEGSYAETDWREGSAVRFLGPERSGMLGRVVTSRRPEVVSVEMEGLVDEGRDDTTSETARAYRGARETYRLSATSTGTRLDVSAPMGDEHYDAMVVAWDDALERVRRLAEDVDAAAPGPTGR